MKKKIGFRDDPATTQDDFSISQYIHGLSAYISECETPMTIAVQGDWGSGKTSIMNMVRNHLGDEVISVWFNTWKFSQFDMDGNLALVFLTYLTEALGQYADHKWLQDFKILVSAIGKGSVKFLGDLSEEVLKSSVIKDMTQQAFDMSVIESIDKLKHTFQKMVNSISDKNNGKSIVFYIDDLDRLQPIRAIEILEVLKVFLDCENCVFVLAIDYEVVSQGIKEKYNNTLDERKSKKFFEKIIQVPFKMPVAHYDIDAYVRKLLGEIDEEEKKYVKDYIMLIRNSIGCNPRAMKRVFNAYTLLEKVHSGEHEITDAHNKMLLFGSLCMQLSYEEVYNYIIEHLYEDERDEDAFVVDAAFFQRIQKDGLSADGVDSELYGIVSASEEYDVKEVEAFLQSYVNAIKQEAETVSDSMIENLCQILQMSSVTSTGNVVKGNDIKGKGARYAKAYDDEYTIRTIDAVIQKKIKSFNKCLVEWYRIGENKTVCDMKKFNFAVFLKEALDLAYKKKPEEFELFREEAMANERHSFYKFFQPHLLANASAQFVSEHKYPVSTFSNNNRKAEQICSIYTALGLEDELKNLQLSMKEATNVE